MHLSDLFLSTAILDGGPSAGKAEVLGQLLGLLAQAGHVEPDAVPALLSAVLRREQLGSTGIGNGLAIPHLKHPSVTRSLGILALCQQPVGFDALDGEPVDIVALCLFPPMRPNQHLGEASRETGELFRRLTKPEFLDRLRHAESVEEITELVEVEGQGMTRREWLACTDPAAMLKLVRERGLLTQRKTYLIVATTGRRLWDQLRDRGRRAIAEAIPNLAGNPLNILQWAIPELARAQAAQAAILRCLFGSPPFRPVVVKPEWLAFADGVVGKLARGICDEGAFDRMPILADALEEAGATDTDLLKHLRGPGPHCQGCFVLDSLLAKQ
jgi:mannitol/fructose-specific phosphotransferase system IIA component (Ntr-type)